MNFFLRQLNSVTLTTAIYFDFCPRPSNQVWEFGIRFADWSMFASATRGGNKPLSGCQYRNWPITPQTRESTDKLASGKVASEASLLKMHRSHASSCLVVSYVLFSSRILFLPFSDRARCWQSTVPWYQWLNSQNENQEVVYPSDFHWLEHIEG